jgi:hypothetical protein
VPVWMAYRVGATMTNSRRVTLSDAPELAWFWALGDADIEYGGTTHPIGAQWRSYVDSALAYLAEYQPPVLEHHDRESRPLGVVRRARELTRDEAAALGLEQTHGRALYLGVNLNQSGRAADERGELIYGSLGLDFDYRDEHGRSWPMAIKEFSCVTVPHLKVGQIQRPSLRSIQLSDPGGIMTDNETPALDVGAVMAAIEALAAQVAQLTEMMGATPGETPDDAPEMGDKPEMMDGEAEEEEPAEAADLREQVARLSVQLAGYEADREIAKLRERCALDDKSAAKARSLYMRDREAFTVLASALPERPKATERKGGASPDKSLTLSERATQIQTAKGVTFADACRIALAEGYTRAEG